jgi:hypothetical protein
MAAVVLGSAIRIEQFLWRRSLWLDEALVANNIVSRSFGGLTHPLGGEQGAPIGWLWVQRTMVIVFGNNEYALRIVPLLAGIAALAFVYWTARRVVGPWSATLAVWIFALLPQAIRYSVEVKQYSTDLAISAGLIFLALETIEHRVVDGRLDRRAITAWGVVGAITVWWSHPAIFVLVATAAVLAVVAFARRSERRVVALACVPWVVSFAVDWVVSLRRLGQDPFLHQFWIQGFAPRPFRLTTYVPWLVRTPSHLTVDPGGIPAAGIAAVVAALGLAVAVTRRPAAGALVVLPLVVAIGAASIGAYPIEGRLALWLLPTLVIGLAGAVGAAVQIAETIEPMLLAAVCLATVLLLRSPTASSLSIISNPTTFNDIRPLMQAVHRDMRSGDQVWIHASDNAATRFYALITGTVLTEEIDDEPGGACLGNANLAGVADRHRVWLIYGYHGSGAPLDEEQALVDALRSHAHLVMSLQRPGADAYLLDFAAHPDFRRPIDTGLTCVTVAYTPPVIPTGLTTGPFGTGHHV